MRRLTALLLLLPVCAAAQAPAAAGKTGSVSSGGCSPNIVAGASGPATVRLVGVCKGVDPRLVKDLTATLQKFLAQFPKTIPNLNELLGRKNVELARKVREAEDWARRYSELSKRLEEAAGGDELSKQAAQSLKAGSLTRAEALLQQQLSKDQQQVDRTARDHFHLGMVYDLRFQAPPALAEYREAYQDRPQEFAYAYAYATLLYAQNRRAEAEPVYGAALKDRDAKDSNPSDLAQAADALNNLGLLQPLCLAVEATQVIQRDGQVSQRRG